MAEGVMIITGGGRGIGAATARLGAEAGYGVCINYVRADGPAEALAAKIRDTGGKALAVQADVAREEEVERLFDTASRELGPVTALVNNAGLTGQAARLDEASDDDIRLTVDVNVMGALWCCRSAIRRMSTSHGGGGGAIVNVSSGAATLGSPGTYVWYAASKGAVDSLTIGLAQELGGEGIRVNAVAPGLIRTEIHDASGLPGRLERLGPSLPMQRAGEPEEVAEAILWLLSAKASYVTGAILRVAGGR